MSPPVEIRPPAKHPEVARTATGNVMKVLLVVAATVMTMWGLNAVVFVDPSRVERVTIDNGSEYDIHIDVFEAGSVGRLPVGVAVQHCATDFSQVLDQGATWEVRFRTQGVDGGAVIVDRAQLERDGWMLRIPDDVITHLRAAGAPPPPVHGCPSR